MSKLLLPRRTRCSSGAFTFGGAAIALLMFIGLTWGLIEGKFDASDSAYLLTIERARRPWLTNAAIDITALGSFTLVILFSFVTFTMLWVLRNRQAALQILAASVGSGLLTLVTKYLIERIRPESAQQLVAVSGFSYPSGHSVSSSALYLTIAFIACRYAERPRTRVAIVFGIAVLIFMVGASRVYLGVHYASDVVSGIALGAAWAFILAGSFARQGCRGQD
jgi:undecaprenyl-diphosphatase